MMRVFKLSLYFTFFCLANSQQASLKDIMNQKNQEEDARLVIVVLLHKSSNLIKNSTVECNSRISASFYCLKKTLS